MSSENNVLTDQESEVLDLAVQMWNEFLKLPIDHPDDVKVPSRPPYTATHYSLSANTTSPCRGYLISPTPLVL